MHFRFCLVVVGAISIEGARVDYSPFFFQEYEVGFHKRSVSPALRRAGACDEIAKSMLHLQFKRCDVGNTTSHVVWRMNNGDDKITEPVPLMSCSCVDDRNNIVQEFYFRVMEGHAYHIMTSANPPSSDTVQIMGQYEKDFVSEYQSTGGRNGALWMQAYLPTDDECIRAAQLDNPFRDYNRCHSVINAKKVIHSTGVTEEIPVLECTCFNSKGKVENLFYARMKAKDSYYIFSKLEGNSNYVEVVYLT